MKINNDKRGSLGMMALIFGIAMIIVGSIELILMALESSMEGFSLLFFTSPGDAVFESAILDHVMKAFVNFIIGGIFLYGYPKIKAGSLEGFSFLMGGGILLAGLGFLFITVWTANLIDTAIISLVEPEIWSQYIVTNGIRIEWFLAIGSINILSIWKKKEQYLN
ncbi:MAG: hypothetical protein ACOC4M_14730 [Promethearchaeia archaeon]